MGIHVSRGVLAYLRERNRDTLVLSLTAFKVGCCSPWRFKDVEVSFEPPPESGRFWLRHIEGVRVFVDRNLDPEDIITVSRFGFGKFAFLHAECSSTLV